MRGKIKYKLQLHNPVPTPMTWPWTKDPKTHETGPFVGSSWSKVFPYILRPDFYTPKCIGQVLWQVFTHQDPLGQATMVTALYLLGTRLGTIAPRKQLMQQTSDPSTSLQLMKNSNYLVIFKLMFWVKGFKGLLSMSKLWCLCLKGPGSAGGRSSPQSNTRWTWACQLVLVWHI
jgi:hypothetical protein